MNKKIVTFIFLLIIFTLPSVKAETNIKGYVTKNDTLFTSKDNITLSSCLVKINGKASTDYGAPGTLHCLDSAEEVTILNYDSIISSTIDSCEKGYYYVNAKAGNGNYYKGYVCADNITANINTSKYALEFANAGFNESYFEKLTILKEAHPNWIFKAFKTNLNWEDAVNAESIVGISYIQVTNLSTGSKYISLEEGSYDPTTKQFIAKEGTNWYAANKQTVAYYLDPRNFLTEKEIFMFENLSYNKEYQTLEVVQNIFKNTDLYDYASTYIEAATYNNNNVSPISLAASSRQEVVLSDGKLSNSANGSKIFDTAVYNFFNLGAYSSGCEINGTHESNPITCGLFYAYNRKWLEPKTAILEGATEVARGYISQGQNTLYFKKFNVTSNSFGNFSHQYMTNIGAPKSEGTQTYEAYSKIEGLLDSSIEFIIPIYENMPTSTSLPTSINEEEKNKIEEEKKKEEEEKKQEKSITDIVSQAGYKYNDSYLSNIKIGSTAGALISNFKGSNENITINITTTDDSGATKEIQDSVILGTGDIVTIKYGEDTKSFRIVIYGDVNGDGKVSAVDYVKIKNYIMSTGDLSGSYKLAADVNGDGKVSAVDYVNIKNYIMGNESVLK